MHWIELSWLCCYRIKSGKHLLEWRDPPLHVLPACLEGESCCCVDSSVGPQTGFLRVGLQCPVVVKRGICFSTNGKAPLPPSPLSSHHCNLFLRMEGAQVLSTNHHARCSRCKNSFIQQTFGAPTVH